MAEPSALDDISFDPHGFRPFGGYDSHRVGPAMCGCGITAQYASLRFGYLCAPCFRKWRDERAAEALKATVRDEIMDAYQLPAALRGQWDHIAEERDR